MCCRSSRDGHGTPAPLPVSPSWPLRNAARASIVRRAVIAANVDSCVAICHDTQSAYTSIGVYLTAARLRSVGNYAHIAHRTYAAIHCIDVAPTISLTPLQLFIAMACRPLTPLLDKTPCIHAAYVRARSVTHARSILFRSLAVLDPRVGHTMDVLSPFIPVLRHSD